MIFFGRLRKPEQQFIWKLGKEGVFDGRDVQIIGSGSFTFEQILKHFSPKTVFGNDISLLTVVVGDYILGRERDIWIKDTREGEIFRPLLEDRMDGTLGKAASVLSVYHYTSYYPLNNLHKVRLFNQELKRFDRVYEGCVEFLKEFKEKVRLDDLVVRDGVEVIGDKSRLYIWHLPFSEGDGYLRDYRLVNAVFGWDAPEYRKMTTERNISHLRKFISEGYDFLFFTSHYVDDCRDYILAKFKYKNNDIVYVYGNFDERVYWAKRWAPATAPGNYPMLSDEFVFTEETDIGFRVVDRKTFNYYRELFIGKDKVRFYSNPSDSIPVLLFADSKFFGFLLFARDRFSYKLGKRPYAFLVSDFRVPSEIRRLSKLVIMLARSKEMKRLYEHRYGVVVDELVTAVYTEKPVSMKYRGEYSLIARKKKRIGEETFYYLTYKASFGNKSLKEEYLLWLKKHFCLG